MTLSEAVHDFYRHVTREGYPRWLAAIGEGKDKIVLFTKTKRAPALPKEWQGWPIKVTHSGEFRMCYAFEV